MSVCTYLECRYVHMVMFPDLVWPFPDPRLALSSRLKPRIPTKGTCQKLEGCAIISHWYVWQRAFGHRAYPRSLSDFVYAEGKNRKYLRRWWNRLRTQGVGLRAANPIQMKPLCDLLEGLSLVYLCRVRECLVEHSVGRNQDVD